jgi:hypothetical protein
MMVIFFYFLTWPVLKIFYFTTHINIQNHLNIIYYLTELYQNQDELIQGEYPQIQIFYLRL